MSMRFSARVPVSAGMWWCVVGVVVVTVSFAYGGTPVSYSTTVVDRRVLSIRFSSRAKSITE